MGKAYSHINLLFSLSMRAESIRADSGAKTTPKSQLLQTFLELTVLIRWTGRHGEGYHNVAESYYGTPAWNVSYFSPFNS
jgi:hypothetical protein